MRVMRRYSPASILQTEPIIVHAHIPKTAGTTVHELLQHNFGADHLLHWNPDPLACLSLAEVEKIVDERPTLRSVSSHSFRYCWPKIGGRPTLPITFLRNPTAVFLSLLRYTRRQFSRMPDEAKRWWPENVPELGLRDLAECYLNHISRVTSSSQLCQQTRYFCPLKLTKPFFTRDSTVYGHNSFSIAVRALESFFFIGLVEEMDASIRVLQNKLRRFGIDLVISGRAWANQTGPSECLDWLNKDDSVGRRVLTANQNDDRLYQRFAERFRKDFSVNRE